MVCKKGFGRAELDYLGRLRVARDTAVPGEAVLGCGAALFSVALGTILKAASGFEDGEGPLAGESSGEARALGEHDERLELAGSDCGLDDVFGSCRPLSRELPRSVPAAANAVTARTEAASIAVVGLVVF